MERRAAGLPEREAELRANRMLLPRASRIVAVGVPATAWGLAQ